MAGGSLLTLLDDVATLADDLAVLAKVAAKKTSAVLGDDVAVVPESLRGVRADRELPVVYAVAKGSMINKAFLVPAAMLISYIAPWMIIPILMLGGAYLCLEGMEKVTEKLFGHSDDPAERQAKLLEMMRSSRMDPAQAEKAKIRGAIRTDCVLSAEIIVITLGTVAGQPLIKQFLVLSLIAIAVTIGIYLLVAMLVRLDDVGFSLMDKPSKRSQSLGRFLVNLAPKIMKVLGIVGTIAMFLVGGGITAHGVPMIGDFFHGIEHVVATVPVVGGVLETLTSLALEGALGLAVGAVVMVVVEAGHYVWHRIRGH
ncbi:DUF808 domain-containing protein [Pseudomonas aeruginosa]